MFPWISVQENNSGKDTIYQNKYIMEDSFDSDIKNLSEKIDLVSILFFITIIFSIISILGITLFYIRRYYNFSLGLINFAGFSFFATVIIIIYFVFSIMSDISNISGVTYSDMLGSFRIEFSLFLIGFISIIFSTIYIYFSISYTIEFYNEIKKESNVLEDEISKLLNKDVDEKPLLSLNETEPLATTTPKIDIAQGDSEIDKWLKNEKEKEKPVFNDDKKDIESPDLTEPQNIKEDEPVEVEILPDKKEEISDTVELDKQQTNIPEVNQQLQEQEAVEKEKLDLSNKLNNTNDFASSIPPQEEKKSEIKHDIEPVITKESEPEKISVTQDEKLKEEIIHEKQDEVSPKKTEEDAKDIKEKEIKTEKINEEKPEIKKEVKPESKEERKTKNVVITDPFKTKKQEKNEIDIDNIAPPEKSFDNVLLSVIDKQQKNKYTDNEPPDKQDIESKKIYTHNEEKKNIIKLRCPSCKNVFSVKKIEGKITVKCPHCGKKGEIE